ncbi:glycosyltransferase [Rubritalea profundi]|uniref:Glycosyl transferase family 1 domain-containing protein n=1 Tax=Rubritalea profundi TaxID=1658618 RepID=A0A2S7TZ80_9BACT|nr:glycosyltransferase [Rubritalea profundi]PQJ28058.1 hypothetical protein BSZ32_05780 [Rubritalea profundi]
MKHKVLFITMHPLGESTGGSIASLNFLKMVFSVFDGQVRAVIPSGSESIVRDHGVEDLVLLDQRNKLDKAVYFLRGICRDRYTPYVDTNLETLMVGVSHVFLDGSMLGRFAAVVKNRFTNVKVVMLHHNFERKYYADTKMPWYQRILINRVIDYNQGAGWKQCDMNLTFTEKDKHDLSDAYGNAGEKKCEVIGYHEDCQELKVRKRDKNTAPRVRMIITGNLSVRKGYEGALWFVNEVLPSMDEIDYELIIAGRNPHIDLIDACDGLEAVSLIANPESMDDLLEVSDVFINPSSIGSGIKVRNFDGLRHGLPVLCRKGNEYGFEQLTERVFSIFEDVTDFKQSLTEVTDNRNEVFESYKSEYAICSGVRKLRALTMKDK